MKLAALALDYDGTIATDGAVSPDVRAAIQDVRSRGVAVVIVTGRTLRDLTRVAGGLPYADAVVAENGAVVHIPRSARTRRLAPGPPPAFLEALRQRHVAFQMGQCVVDTSAVDAPAVLSAIRELGLPLAMAFNDHRLMVLPQGLSKATGLRAALHELQISEHNTVAIGNAENDHVLLHACELGVAVAWGQPALIASADTVAPGRWPRDLAPYIRNLGELGAIPSGVSVRSARRHNQTDDGKLWTIDLEGENALIVGDAASGKSWVAGLLAEQWLAQGYAICVIDPEGDYSALQTMPGTVCLGRSGNPPPLPDIISVLRHPDLSLILDLSQVQSDKKVGYVRELLAQLAILRKTTGRPHRLIIDEAHYFLSSTSECSALDLNHGGHVFVTYLASALPSLLQQHCSLRLATRLTRPEEVESLRREVGGGDPTSWVDDLPRLAIGEVLELSNPGGTQMVRRVQLPPRLTDHVRHRVKYVSVPVPLGKSFVFTQGNEATGRQADTIRSLADFINDEPDDVLAGHLSRGDFSRWVDEVYGDRCLAADLRALEQIYAFEAMSEIRAALAKLIHARYAAPEEIEIRSH